ncbi:hypothetical protein BH11MYX2_BH11MYX2_37790 [soil metagenome]
MFWSQSAFFGMHYVWWVVWFALIFGMFSFWTPVSRRRARLYEHPLATLSRRYAAGELTTMEYDERRERIAADLGAGVQPPMAMGNAKTQSAYGADGAPRA